MRIDWLPSQSVWIDTTDLSRRRQPSLLAMEISLIVFAGPGSLWELSRQPDFRCVLSVEMDPWATETLTTRAFVHLFH